jgi:hypothetical protein
MNKKSLSLTNPFLKELEARKKLAARSAKTSCGVEGIRVTDNTIYTWNNRKPKRIHTNTK